MFYAGIGSRETPFDILNTIKKISKILENKGYILRSGNADGADKAFQNGCINKEIYLPWNGYNNLYINNKNIFSVSDKAIKYSLQFHPNKNILSNGAKKLHGRNSQIIMGYNLDTPVDFVLCWHNYSGGTMQAVRIAKCNDIPVYNINNDKEYYNFINKYL